MENLIFFGFVIFVILLIADFVSGRKQRDAMWVLATKLDLGFDPAENRSLVGRYSFLEKFRGGSNRYVCNVLSGNYQGHDVVAFDYHYETGSGDDTHYYHCSFFIMHLTAAFPELVIGPENIFEKIAQAVGYDDIDFESREFSSKFCVRSADKKFAYDVCNARMIEYLLSNCDFSIEIESNVLAIAFRRKLAPGTVESNLNQLVTVRSLMPDYLFAER